MNLIMVTDTRNNSVKYYIIDHEDVMRVLLPEFKNFRVDWMGEVERIEG